MRMLRLKQEIMDDDEKGKLFVGGLSWETTQDNLQRYFARYGEVIDCVVMKNAESGRSRGFGFVTFADPANVNMVLQNGPHTLDGRTIDPKPCNPRTLQKPKKGGGYPKVFLGGLPSNVTETDLRTFFTRFGKVMEVVIMYDQEKKKSRGFGFLSFEDEEAVDRCVSEHFVNLNGKQVEIKKAEPRDGSGGNKMGGADPSSAWGPPQPPMSMMQGPNGQMGGAPMNLGAPMGPNLMQSYQGWGASPQQQSYAGYANPSGPGSYQGWGAPPAPQGPPPQWGNNYGGPPQQQGYGSYGPNAGGSAASWNSWNMPQNSGSTGYIASEMYSRGQSGPGGPGAASAPPNMSSSTGSTKPGSAADYSNYASYGSYTTDGGAYGAPPRSYGSDAGSQVGGYSSQQPPNADSNPPAMDDSSPPVRMFCKSSTLNAAAPAVVVHPQINSSSNCSSIVVPQASSSASSSSVATPTLMHHSSSALSKAKCQPPPPPPSQARSLPTNYNAGDYSAAAAGGDSYNGGPQRGSGYITPSQSYHPYRR